MPLDYDFDIGDPPRHVNITTICHYRRLDELDVRLLDEPAWCFDCDDIVGVEHLEPLDKLRADVSEMKRRLRNRQRELKEARRVLDAGSEEEARILDGTKNGVERAERDLAEAKAVVRWRRRRRSPPRCLRCGSIKLQFFPRGHDEFPHPSGRGTIRRNGSGISKYLWLEVGIYDAEGIRLDEPGSTEFVRR